MRHYIWTLVAMAMGGMLMVGCPPKGPYGGGLDDEDDPGDGSSPDEEGEEDEDGDGWSEVEGDCDDSDPSIHPGADEAPYDGVDQDCDGSDLTDVDGDGFDGGELGTDCDDSDPDVNPAAEENACNLVDDDCDGVQHMPIHVPDSFSAIQDAITYASDGETICVAPGIYTENLSFEGKNVRVIGSGGPEVTMIDGSGGGTVVRFDDSETYEALLAGFTIAHGTGSSSSGPGISTYGGAMYIDEASPSLRDLVVEFNQADQCGGLLLMDSSSILEDVRIRNNESLMSVGGGLCVVDSEVTILRAEVENNSAAWGGGVAIGQSTVQFDGSLIAGNQAHVHGGGIYATQSNVDLGGTTVADNVASGSGGGVGLFLTSLEADQLRIEGNSAAQGGGIYAESAESFIIERALFADNESYGNGGALALLYSDAWLRHAVVADNGAHSGGGVYVHTTSIQMSHVSIVGNAASYEGGGLMTVQSPEVHLDHTIVAWNDAAAAGGGMSVHDGPVSARYSAFGANAPQDVVGMGSPVGYEGNVGHDPTFLSTSGASAADWDLHLSADSSLIDAGDPETFDPDGSIADIGAFGGDGADLYDLDGDGFPLWWQPRPYAVDLAVEGFDCDDLDVAVHPGNGC